MTVSCTAGEDCYCYKARRCLGATATGRTAQAWLGDVFIQKARGIPERVDGDVRDRGTLGCVIEDETDEVVWG